MGIERSLNWNEEEYGEQWLDTPIGSPKGKSRNEAFVIPGCHVKSKERRDGSPWPKYFGRLKEISDDKVVVVGKDDKFVWTGKSTAYHSLWECD